MNRSTFSENMKIALLGGTGETGVEVIFGQDKNKHNDADVRFNFKTKQGKRSSHKPPKHGIAQ